MVKKVHLITPSSWVQEERKSLALDWFAKHKITVSLGKHIDKKYYDLGGSDAERAADFMHAAALNVDAIVAFCGGYGATRILRFLDFPKIDKKCFPKFFGYSDITALQLALWSQCNLITFSGFMAASDIANGEISKITNEYFDCIINDRALPPVRDFKVFNHGNASGVLLGGCLSVLVSLIGTPWMVSFKSAILFLEDVNEPTYKIDRMLRQLLDAKVLEGCVGVIFGKFAKCEARNEDELVLEDVLENFVKELNVVGVYDFPYGHIRDKVIMPVGGISSIDTQKNIIEMKY